MSRVYIISISGGSGAGKTTFSQRLRKALGESCALLFQDSYYIDQSDKFDHDGGAVNFDHPSSIDFDLLGNHLDDLKAGQKIEVPIYDFGTHSRLGETDILHPEKIIIVDGTLLLSQDHLLDKFHMKVFVDAPEQIRFERRLKRDVEERERTPEGVRNQFFSQVKPMHDEFVEPSKVKACHIADVQSFDDKLEEIKQELLTHLKIFPH